MIEVENDPMKVLEGEGLLLLEFFCTLSLIRVFMIKYDALQRYSDNQHNLESCSSFLTSPLAEKG